jgi:DNA-binding NarL/FixJ family response regulator
MAARILITDDHEVVRQGIRAILQARPDWEICGEAVAGPGSFINSRPAAATELNTPIIFLPGTSVLNLRI